MSDPVSSSAAGEAPAKSSPSAKTELATFGGGCFWCTEAVYERVPGVKRVVSGYAGGKTDRPTYKQICLGDTGHAEVIQIEFDPGRVTYEQLLEIFFEAHDPTTLNRQGADEGTQYRSVIFYHSDAQKRAAAAAKVAAAKIWDDPIVTEISPAPKFWPAEDYHQNYFAKNPTQGYCSFVIRPKVKKLQEKGVIAKDRDSN
ncbi:MAG TPA: peptide-methionine (S)-S-oxide reductase MsrA [Opitutaceae bacterium]|nr:peptide-methionine (S)-S-oxide reductase MsrA [Opitutaceae bacterium]